MTSQQLVGTTKTFTDLDIEQLVIEDDKGVDNFQSEQQQRLLVEPLYSSPILQPPFLAAANVGLFYQPKVDPIIPDVMLSLGIQRAEDFSEKKNLCYIVEELGKLPEVCIEIVSNQEGDEVTLCRKSERKGNRVAKRDLYTRIGVLYYVVFDPLRKIQTKKDMNGALLRVWKIAGGSYTELTTPRGIRESGERIWLEEVGLGLTLWSGKFEEEYIKLWLRWCNSSGEVIPTGVEQAQFERQQAQFERQRAEFERRRAEFADQQAEFERQQAEFERQRAEFERQRAESERQRAESERRRAEQLAERLRALGINPEDI
jgi:hypothetical protein